MIRKHSLLIAFTGSYMAAASIQAIATGNTEFMIYIAQVVVLIVLILWAHRRARFSTGVLWGLSVWGLMHMAGGLVPVPVDTAQVTRDGQTSAVLYSLWIIPPDRLKYDNVVHAYGFFVATLACWQALRRYLATRGRAGLAFAVVLACAGMGLGAVNEIIEFIATRVSPETNVGGYENNAIDLIYNAIGACTASLIVWIRHAHSFPSWYARESAR